jgi:hypothetical protein
MRVRDIIDALDAIDDQVNRIRNAVALIADDASGPYQRERWRAWCPNAPEPKAFLTREHIIDRLHEDGIMVSSDAIALWQRRGLLPYPDKRREGTATIGYYPDWIVQVIRELRRFQGEGVRLRDMQVPLRRYAQHVSTGGG